MINPYASPTSDIGTHNDLAGATGLQGWYVVSPRKFWVLSLTTMGLYSVAWGYQHWSALKRAKRLNVWPIPRAIFGVFFMHALMRYAKAASDASGRHVHFNYPSAATVAVVVLVLSHITDRLASKSIGSPVTDVVSLLFIAVIAWALWRMQDAINHIVGVPDGASNDRFSGSNWFWMILGLIIWGAAIFGLFTGAVPEEA